MNLLKNRTALGILCIAISLLICFVLMPLVNSHAGKKVMVVRMVKEGTAGERITKSMVTEVEVGSYNLPAGAVKKAEDVIGMYLTADLSVDDMILQDKLTAEPAAENIYLHGLNGEKQAISITIHSFAGGLSGKLKSGDIVSVLAPDYLSSGETVIPLELKYVEVIAVTAKSGYDANTEDGKQKEEEKELPSTVTLLVRPEQSKLLVRLEAEGEIHLSLVYRGLREKAEEFIAAQEQVLEELEKAREEKADQTMPEDGIEYESEYVNSIEDIWSEPGEQMEQED